MYSSRAIDNSVFNFCWISRKYKKDFLAGFDGYKKDDPYSDKTQEILNIFKKQFKYKFLYSLTKTNYIIK